MLIAGLRNFLFPRAKMTQFRLFFFPTQQKSRIINLMMRALRANGDYYLVIRVTLHAHTREQIKNTLRSYVIQ